MTTLQVFFIIAGALLIGICLGAAGYRYMLKRDPERLEQWAKRIKEEREEALDRLHRR